MRPTGSSSNVALRWYPRVGDAVSWWNLTQADLDLARQAWLEAQAIATCDELVTIVVGSMIG